MAKVVAVVSTSCLFLILLLEAFYPRFLVPRGRLFRRTLEPSAIVREVRGLSDLVTVRYTIQNVVGLQEDKLPVGSESILLLVQGKVLAGVDLAQLSESDVSMPLRDTALIRLQPPRIIEAFLDEEAAKVWDRHITWWTPWVSPNPDLEHNARLAALEQVRAAAIRSGILQDARKNAEADIRKILGILGIGKVTFNFGT